MNARWKILIAVVVCVVLMICYWLMTIRIQPENAVETYKKSLRDKGEKLEISEVLPPPVPPESNGVAVAQAAFSLFSTSGAEWTNLPSMMRMVAPGKAIVGWKQSDVRGSDFTNSWENAVAATEADRPGIELLKQAANYHSIDFQPDYSKGPDMLLTHLAPLKRSAQRLSAAAMCNLHDGEAASATTNLCVLLAFVRGVQDERTIISQLVRIAMASIALNANWELLQSTNVTETELVALQTNWERLEFIRATENSILMERATTGATIKKLRASRKELIRLIELYGSFGMPGSPPPSSWTSSGDWFEDAKDLAKSGWDKTKLAGATFMWRVSWTYSDELHALQGEQAVLESLHAIGTNQFFQPSYSNLAVQLTALGITNSSGDLLFDFDDLNLRSLFSGSVGSLLATVRKTMAAETSKRVVVTAIALKRFQLRHGNFPETLSELTPGFLAAIPLDAVDGQPLRYRRNADGTFLLYSIGADGIDQGGDPTNTASGSSSLYWQNPHARDWVWPQPATAEEIQKYYEEQTRKAK